MKNRHSLLSENSEKNISLTQVMVSLVTTVLNDRQGCTAFFAQMEAQTYLPDEIVIVDGGSTDGTWEFLQNYQPHQPYSLQLVQEVGCNVAQGRNLAISCAKHEIIVSTDIGCTWEPQWLEELALPLIKNPQLEAVMGSWQVCWQELKSNWARVEFALLNEPKLLANSTSHASSRSIAYRKSLWKKIGGYPEDLTLAADDMVFALLLHQTTDRVSCAPIPRCYWERPELLKSFCKEVRRNFRGAGEAGIWLKYGLLVGGRLVFELLLLFTSVICWLFLGEPAWIATFCLSFFIIMVGSRMRRLLPAIRCLKNYGYSDQWLNILLFEYLIKIWSLVGYWEGFFCGLKQCKATRNKLRNIKYNPLFN